MVATLGKVVALSGVGAAGGSGDAHEEQQRAGHAAARLRSAGTAGGVTIVTAGGVTAGRAFAVPTVKRRFEARTNGRTPNAAESSTWFWGGSDHTARPSAQHAAYACNARSGILKSRQKSIGGSEGKLQSQQSSAGHTRSHLPAHTGVCMLGFGLRSGERRRCEWRRWGLELLAAVTRTRPKPTQWRARGRQGVGGKRRGSRRR